MVELSDATLLRVRKLFPEKQHQEVIKLLENECGDNLPFCKASTSLSLERLRFAALKLSKGNLQRLHEAIALANRDWRDLLVAADFANDLDAHNRWEYE